MVELFLRYLAAEKRVSKHTLIAYQTDLMQFTSWLQLHYETTPQASTFPMIRSWIGALSDDELQSRSINRKMACLRSFFKYLMREGHVANDPMSRIKSLKTKKTLPHFVKESELTTLLDHSAEGHDFLTSRDKLILEMLYATGIRLSELIGLTDNAVNLPSRTIKVLGKRNKERVIPFPAPLENSITRYLTYRNQEVANAASFFTTEAGEPLKPSMVYRIIRQYLGATSVEKKSPHVLRHTYATHLLNHGAELNAVKDLLGHQSLAATQVYTHNSFEKLKKVFEQAHPKA